MSTLTLARVHRTRLSDAHADYLSSAIRRYREKAERALSLARSAAAYGNHTRAAGLLDEAITYRAMANGLAEQSRHDQIAGCLEHTP
jgi:hypothetical protein